MFIFGVAMFLIWKLLRLKKQFDSERAYLEVTPPAFTDKVVIATEALFSAIHSLGMHRTFSERFLGRQSVFSAEIHSTRKGGITFHLGAEERDIKSLERLVEAYLTDAKIKSIKKVAVAKDTKILEYRQVKHFAFPLHEYDSLGSRDPLGYLTSAMTKLKDGEHMAWQLIMKPVKVREADKIRQNILRNDFVIQKAKISRGFLAPFLGALNALLFGIGDAFSSVWHQSKISNYGKTDKYRYDGYSQQVARGERPVRMLSNFEQELMESMHEKLKRPLFSVDIRVLIQCDPARYQDLKNGMNAAVGLFDVPRYQALKLKRRKTLVGRKLVHLLSDKRLQFPALRPNYFADAELASLFHFPHSESARTENVITSLSKTLPAPVSLKSGRKLDIFIGMNKHHGLSTQIGLTESERERHMYVIGGTGNGKTTLLKYQIIQDIQHGNGVAVVDPHGDLAEELLGHIPEDRIKDVIYINPDDLSRPVAINLLELPEGLTGDDLLREKDLVTESTMSVMRKMFSEDDSGGHRVEYILRNAIQTALTVEGANLFTIFRLLNDPKFRKGVVRQLEDENLKIFWLNELGRAGDMQKVKMSAGITSKIGRFLFSASARRMLEQEKSSVDFDEAMDGKKIIICNFSKGLLGEDTSMLFGVTILAKIQLAALRRARKQLADRQPFYLYVDEFQNFATIGFVQMLSEARKYKLFLVMAEQSTQQQQEQRLVDIILANVGTVIAFRSGSPADERLILPLFKPYILEHEISNLPAYNFYCRISAIDAQEPLSGETVMTDELPSQIVAEEVRKASRATYGRIPSDQSEINKTIKLVKVEKGKGAKKLSALSGLKKKASV